jgi:DNA-binding PadR family transcriptional regulator
MEFNSVTSYFRKDKLIFSTFEENENLYIINNLGNKQILLAKDKKDEFESKIKELKEFHKINFEISKIINTKEIKEDESQESLRINRKNKIKP